MQMIFELCHPSKDIFAGSGKGSDVTANIVDVLQGIAMDEYAHPVRFVANAFPTADLDSLPSKVFVHLSGAGGDGPALPLDVGGCDLVRYGPPTPEPAIGGAKRLRFAAGRSPLLRYSHVCP